MLGDAASLIGSAYGYDRLQGDLKDQQKDVQSAIGNASNMVEEQTRFQPYGVTGGQGYTGTAQVGDGFMYYTPSAGGKKVTNDLMFTGTGLMTQSAQDPVERQRQMYNEMLIAQNPEQERQRALMNQRLHSAGRSGMASNTYGGTPEQLAFEKAIQEQRMNNWMASGQAANQELQGKYERGSGIYDRAWKPQEHMFKAGDQALLASNEANSLGVTRAGLLGQLAAEGVTADLNFNNIKANQYNALMNAMSGSGGFLDSIGGAVENTDLWGQIADGAGQIWDEFWNK